MTAGHVYRSIAPESSRMSRALLLSAAAACLVAGSAAAQPVVLMNDGLSVAGKVLAVDRALDLAVIGTEGGDVTPVTFDSDAEPALGDAIVTVGRGMAPMALGFRSLGPYASGRSDAASRAILGVAMRPPLEEERAAIPGGVGQVVAQVSIGLRLGVPWYAYDTVTFRGEIVAVEGDLVTIKVVGSNSLGDHVIATAKLSFGGA